MEGAIRGGGVDGFVPLFTGTGGDRLKTVPNRGLRPRNPLLALRFVSPDDIFVVFITGMIRIFPRAGLFLYHPSSLVISDGFVRRNHIIFIRRVLLSIPGSAPVGAVFIPSPLNTEIVPPFPAYVLSMSNIY